MNACVVEMVIFEKPRNLMPTNVMILKLVFSTIILSLEGSGINIMNQTQIFFIMNKTWFENNDDMFAFKMDENNQIGKICSLTIHKYTRIINNDCAHSFELKKYESIFSKKTLHSTTCIHSNLHKGYKIETYMT